MDGSESRGALSAAIDVSYGSSAGATGSGSGTSKTNRPSATGTEWIEDIPASSLMIINSYLSAAKIRVWTPRTPLSVVVDDQRLRQV